MGGMRLAVCCENVIFLAQRHAHKTWGAISTMMWVPLEPWGGLPWAVRSLCSAVKPR